MVSIEIGYIIGAIAAMAAAVTGMWFDFKKSAKTERINSRKDLEHYRKIANDTFEENKRIIVKFEKTEGRLEGMYKVHASVLKKIEEISNAKNN